MADQPDAPERDRDDLKAADAMTLHQTVREEGEVELSRPAGALFWSGLAAGLAITASLLTESALQSHLPDTMSRFLIVSLGYPVGFLIVILGRLQLFTESTITAMLPFATTPSWNALGRTLRLWGIVLGANLIGTCLASWLISIGAIGSTELRESAVAVSMPVMDLGALATFRNAIPAGFLIAIIAWTLPNAREQSFLLIFAVTYVVAIGGFSHSIAGSDKVFLLIFTGHAEALTLITQSMIPAILGNLVGGAFIFALLAHAQVKSDESNAEGADG